MAFKPLSQDELNRLEKGFRASQQKQRKGVVRYAPAIGATVAGVAAAPFTGGLSLAGTLAALGAAGAVGSGVGEFAAQKAAREQSNLARVAKEAAIGGATSAVPIGGFARGAKVARTAAQAGEGAATMLPTKGIGNIGRRLETRAGGYGIGEKLTGKAPINLQSQSRINATLKAERIKPGHPEDMANQASLKMDQYHSQMEAALDKTNRPLSLAERKSIAADYLKKVNASPTVDRNIRRNAVEFANNFVKQTKDVKSINAFRRGVDKNAISYIANPDAATAAKQEAAQVLRGHLSDTISKLAPSVKAVNTKYAKLANANDYMVAQSGRLTRQSENAGGGITGRVLTGDNAQTFKAKSGAALSRVGDATAGAGKVRAPATELVKQSVARPIVNGVTGTEEPALDPNDPYATDALHGYSPDNEITNEMVANGELPADQLENMPQGPATLEEALNQAQQLLGPNQTPATYLSYAKALQSSGKQNANQQKTQMALQNAQNVVDELTQAYKAAGGPQGAVTGSVRNVLGNNKLPIDQSARTYNDLRQAFLSRIARAFGEVGTLNEGDINRALRAIPSLNDNRQSAATKLATLNSLLRKAQQNNAGGGSDLTEVLQQLQGAY